MADDRYRCAAASTARHEPLLGTASRVRRWLLVEQPGPWGRNALLESNLDREVALALAAAARASSVRVVLVRRPGWTPPSPTRRVALAHVDRDGGWLEWLDLAADDAGALLRLDLRATASTRPPGIGRSGSAHLVCTNGRHDACCADAGRPVVRALAAAGVDDVWEVSHIGGDRFAANVVCLPSGVYFGRVGPDEAAALVAELAGGRIDLDRCRGRCCFPPLVQAAEILVRRQLDERRLDALRVECWERDGDGAGASVDLVHDGRELRAVVAADPAGSHQLTCGASADSPVVSYRLVSLGER